jgi:CHAT domain-containing protein
VAREQQRLTRALAPLQRRGLVELHWLAGQSWRDLQRTLRRGPWHIFHFMGHGGFDAASDEGFLAFADEDGRAERLGATRLARLLGDHDPLRLALLNACEGARSGGRDQLSSTASILVQRGVPAVLAMQYEITDVAAIEFASSFYETLADGEPVDAAVTEARSRLSAGWVDV